MEQKYENEDEIFEKKETHVEGKIVEKVKKFIIPIIALSIILILIIIEFTTHCFSNLINSNAKVGNTIGNITNCGYSVESGNYIYYVAPGENMEKVNINKVEKGNSDSQTIYEGDYDIRSLNISNNKIYFISLSYENLSENDSVNNKIYSINLDGSESTVINDNEFANDFLDMYVVGNKIYYVGTDYNVYSMDLKGGNRQLEVESHNGFLAINNKYIVYYKEKEGNENYVTCIKSLNKNDEREITNSRVNTPNIYGDYVYYINENTGVSRINVNGGEPEVIHEGSVYNMNIYNGNIYYLNYKDEANEDYTVCIFKISVDGGDAVNIKELAYYSSFINVVNGYIYLMDMNIEEGKSFISLVNVDDSSEIILHEWKFGEQ